MEVTTNRLAIQQAFKQGAIQAICGYPGIGKSYLEAHTQTTLTVGFPNTTI